MLKDKLQDDLKESMRAKDTVRTSVIRMVKSAVNYYEIQKGGAGYEASDEDVMTVLHKEVKQRRDSIEQFNAAGRKELADKEIQELNILQAYLPAEIGEDEIRGLIETAILQTQATTQSDMGKVMAALMPKVKGKADGTLVSRIVKEKLQ